MEEKLKELREAYDKSMEENNSLEVQLRFSHGTILNLEESIHSLNEKLFEAESAVVSFLHDYIMKIMYH